MPLPMMALLRLNTDIPNDVFPSNCWQGARSSEHREGGGKQDKRLELEAGKDKKVKATGEGRYP